MDSMGGQVVGKRGLTLGTGAVTDNQILKCLRAVAARLSSDHELQKDLVQEMFLHLLREQVASPGKPLSWYLKSCEFRARNYLRLGRSIDSLKRARNGTSWNDGDHAEPICHDPNFSTTAVEKELQGQLITDDIIDMVLPHISERQQQVLFMLAKGFGVREIGRALGISHPAVIKHRRRIAKIATEVLADQAIPAKHQSVQYPGQESPS